MYPSRAEGQSGSASEKSLFRTIMQVHTSYKVCDLRKRMFPNTKRDHSLTTMLVGK